MPKLLVALTAVASTAGLALTSSTGASAAATDDTPGYSVQALSVDVKVGPADEPRCRIDADLYLPAGASRSHRVPAILSTHGFGGDKADSNPGATGHGFRRQGDAVLWYSGPRLRQD